MTRAFALARQAAATALRRSPLPMAATSNHHSTINFSIAYSGAVSRSCLSGRGILLSPQIVLCRDKDKELFRTLVWQPVFSKPISPYEKLR
jgi:hypothetical protein